MRTNNYLLCSRISAHKRASIGCIHPSLEMIDKIVIVINLILFHAHGKVNSISLNVIQSVLSINMNLSINHKDALNWLGCDLLYYNKFL